MKVKEGAYWRRVIERCDLCKGPVSNVFMLLAGSQGIVCYSCAIGKPDEILRLELEMAEAYQQLLDELV